ncbi:hypothetical protein D3OALGA1CA_3738 [Olavius algarvensis associated proteobacterium Delta 3]|nr:hypothetical protein D3OALGA1CA_3738 [Olavius algarvensis associated proteobacterium Delta 3]
MDEQLESVLGSIGEDYQGKIQKGARHYLEVSVGKQAEKMGFYDLKKKYENTYVVVPLRGPQKGMKVRIAGRTFVNYAEYPSGIAVPGYLAKEAGKSFKTFIPNDSMICNFT